MTGRNDRCDRKCACEGGGGGRGRVSGSGSGMTETELVLVLQRIWFHFSSVAAHRLTGNE